MLIIFIFYLKIIYKIIYFRYKNNNLFIDIAIQIKMRK